ncbi:MAG: hypothetical protein WD431_14050 [Cyclobacteriaceae bacterium]
MNLKEISLYLTEDIYVIQEELKQKQLAEKFTSQYGQEETKDQNHSEKASTSKVEEPLSDLEKKEDFDPEPINFEGEFKKGILIIYQGKELSALNREFLMKILQAIPLSLKDIALLSEKNLLANGQDPVAQLNPNKMIIFGNFHHPIMRLKRENYQIQQDRVECFYADEFEEIQNSTPLKRKLWSTLQLFFNIKK